MRPQTLGTCRGNPSPNALFHRLALWQTFINAARTVDVAAYPRELTRDQLETARLDLEPLALRPTLEGRIGPGDPFTALISTCPPKRLGQF
jgi:hypothetical protein